MIGQLYFVLAAWYLVSVKAQTKSDYQSFTGRANSYLECWGDYNATTDILSGAAPLEGVASKPLAEFCHESLAGMECGFNQDPARPYFGGAGFYTDEGALVLNVGYDGTAHEQWVAWLACWTKCSCKGQNIVTTAARYNANPANQTYMFSFDTGLASGPPAGMTDNDRKNAMYFYGFDSYFVIGKYNNGNNPPPRYRHSINQDLFFAPPDTKDPVTSVAVIGNPYNAPICGASPNLAESLPPELYSFLEGQGVNNVPTTAADLCPHTLYGGRNRTNMGAVCIKPQSGTGTGTGGRELSINSMNTSPPYTLDYYRSSLRPFLAIQLLEIFCFAACYCAGESDTVRQQRLDAWNLRVAAVEKVGSPENTELQDEVTNTNPSAPGIAVAAGTSTSTATAQPTSTPSTISSTFSQQQCQIQNGGQCPNCNPEQACSSNTECGSHCTCAVVPGQSINTFLNYAAPVILACAVQVLAGNSWLGDKVKARRELDGPNAGGVNGAGTSAVAEKGVITSPQYCACNSTYVSGACCRPSAWEGNVWEGSGQNVLEWSILKT